MRVWTVHVREVSGDAAGHKTEPVLVPEKFTWGGFVFGPFWLLAHRAWIPAVITLVMDIAITVMLPNTAGTILDIGLAWIIGLAGNDLRRWSLARRGFAMADIVAERHADAALWRVLDRRPGLMPRALPLNAAP